MRARILLAAVLAVGATSLAAHAFCGFYVAGSNQKLFNDATQVTLLRDGTRTVLSMQNDYRGPLDDFAMVVPVPVVLKETDVKVVDPGVFQRLDSLGSPRLVEYWEQDPCPPPVDERMMKREMALERAGAAPRAEMSLGGGGVDYAPEPAPPVKERKPVKPILASFSVSPPSITAGAATPITWTFSYANSPYPDPICTVDHKVGNVYAGLASNVTLAESTTFTLTCANSAGKAEKQARVNVVKIEAKFDVA